MTAPVLGTPASGVATNLTGTAASLTAGAATILATARNIWGQSFDGSAAITGSLTGVADITGGASSMAITAGTGNSRTLTLKSTTSGGTATAFLTGNADQSSTFGGNISGTGAWSITGGAGNMTIISGTGASRTMILQTTTSGSTATTALTLGADQSATFAGHLVVEGVTSTGATGTGKFVFDGSPALVTPALGTPASGVMTNVTGLPNAGLSTSSGEIGGAWASFTPTRTNITISNGTETSKYYRIGKTIIWHYNLTFGSSTSVSGDLTLSLPATSVAYGGAGASTLGAAGLFDSSAGRVFQAQAQWNNTTTVVIRPQASDLTYGYFVQASSTVPFTWATSDEITFTLAYEAA